MAETAIITSEQFEDVLEDSQRARTPSALRAMAAASSSIWRFLGARAGQDLAYLVGAVEEHPHRGAGEIWLRRRPVSAITQIRLIGFDGSTLAEYEETNARIANAEEGLIQGLALPRTRTYALAGYERTQVGPAYPNLQVTFTGGWVTQQQYEANSSLTKDIPAAIEEACLRQALHIYESSRRDFDVSSRGDESSNVVYRDRRGFGRRSESTNPMGIIPEAADLLRPYCYVSDPLA